MQESSTFVLWWLTDFDIHNCQHVLWSIMPAFLSSITGILIQAFVCFVWCLLWSQPWEITQELFKIRPVFSFFKFFDKALELNFFREKVLSLRVHCCESQSYDLHARVGLKSAGKLWMPASELPQFEKSNKLKLFKYSIKMQRKKTNSSCSLKMMK